MIIGIGADISDIERVDDALRRQGQRFRNRICSVREQAAAAEAGHPTLFYALRFAAKEACAKALGTGITDRVRWTHIEILADQSGRLELHLSEGALRRARRLAGSHSVKAYLSTAQDKGFVMAFVLLDAS
jgi:holo-[acyl-carrier protein] synthase